MQRVRKNNYLGGHLRGRLHGRQVPRYTCLLRRSPHVWNGGHPLPVAHAPASGNLDQFPVIYFNMILNNNTSLQVALGLADSFLFLEEPSYLTPKGTREERSDYLANFKEI